MPKLINRDKLLPASLQMLSTGDARQTRSKPWAEPAAEALLFLGCSLPGLLLSFHCLQEPWTLFRIARSSLSLDAGHIVRYVTAAAGYRSEHIGGEIVQTALLSATRWPAASLALLPIGSLLIAMQYYAVCRLITRSRLVAAAIAVYSAAYYPRLFSQYAVQTYAWTNLLFLTFLTLLICWLSRGEFQFQLLALFIFVATFLHYHTTPIWMIVLLCLAVLWLKSSRPTSVAGRMPVSWALPLFALVFFLQFDTVLYGDVLARLSADSGGEALIRSVLSKFIAPILDRSPDGLPPLEMAPTNPRIATWSNLAILLMLTIPVGLWGLAKLRHSFQRRSMRRLAERWEDLLVWAMVILSLMHAILYSTYGALSLRVVPLSFPLLIPIVLPELRLGKKIEWILPMGLAAFAVLGFCSFLSAFRPDTLPGDTGFVASLIDDDSVILADATTYGAILTVASESQKRIDFIWPDASNYASLVSGREDPQAGYDLFIADSTGKPVTASSWVSLEPWTQHLDKINQNPFHSKIYDSDHLHGFTPPGAELPQYLPVQLVTKPPGTSLLHDSLRLFTAVVCLLFLPGVACLLVIPRIHGPKIDDFHGFIALASGMSIGLVTFTGYLLNFTPTGIRPVALSTMGVSILTLTGILLFHKQSRRFPGRWLRPAISLLVVLFIWSFLATAVAHAREREHANFIEFFVTSTDPQSTPAEGLMFYVVNRSPNSKTFTISLEAEGDVVEIGPRKVTANSIWRSRWIVPKDFEPDLMEIVLKEGGMFRAGLHLRQFGWQRQAGYFE